MNATTGFGSADYDAFQEYMEKHSFRPVSHTNVNRMNVEYNEY